MAECPTPDKHKHRSEAAALAARDSHERVKGIDLGLRAYRCPCGSWHLGHPHKNDQARSLRGALAAGSQAHKRRRR